MTDPLLQAIFDKLPEEGNVFKTEDRLIWLQAVAMAFQLIYGPDVEIEIRKEGLRP